MTAPSASTCRSWRSSRRKSSRYRLPHPLHACRRLPRAFVRRADGARPPQLARRKAAELEDFGQSAQEAVPVTSAVGGDSISAADSERKRRRVEVRTGRGALSSWALPAGPHGRAWCSC